MKGPSLLILASGNTVVIGLTTAACQGVGESKIVAPRYRFASAFSIGRSLRP